MHIFLPSYNLQQFMIQVIKLYPVNITNNFYTNNTINHQDLKFMDLKNMASVIGLDGVELVQYIIIQDPQYHKYQE
jgi:hypothetical protein